MWYISQSDDKHDLKTDLDILWELTKALAILCQNKDYNFLIQNWLSTAIALECCPVTASQQFSHYHFTSKNIFRVVLYHTYNTFTADLDRLEI